MRIPFLTKGSLRYCWLPSSGLPHGTGSGSPLQFKFYSSNLPDDATIVIVEGALKATFSLPSTLSCMSSQPRESRQNTPHWSIWRRGGERWSASTRTIITTKRSVCGWPHIGSHLVDFVTNCSHQTVHLLILITVYFYQLLSQDRHKRSDTILVDRRNNIRNHPSWLKSW